MSEDSADDEAALLGTVIRNPKLLCDARARPAHFGHYAKFWSAVLAADAGNRPIDLQVLNDILPSSEWEDFAESAPLSRNVAYYDERVRTAGSLRAFQSVCQRGVSASREEVQALTDELFRVTTEGEAIRTLPTHELADSAETEIRHVIENGLKNGRLSTGISGLDDICTSFEPGSFVLLAGRPSFGKTTLARQIACSVGQRDPVAFFSIEESSSLLMQKIIATEAGVGLHRILSGQVPLPDRKMILEKIHAATGRVKGTRLWINDEGSITTQAIRHEARRIKAREGALSLVIVDYIGLIQTPNGHSRADELQRVSRDLKIMAKDLGACVLALSQLNRRSEDRENKKPRLSDLRDSGALEQDADCVIFIYSEAIEDDTRQVVIAKQRNGPAGLGLTMGFDKDTVRLT